MSLSNLRQLCKVVTDKKISKGALEELKRILDGETIQITKKLEAASKLQNRKTIGAESISLSYNRVRGLMQTVTKLQISSKAVSETKLKLEELMKDIVVEADGYASEAHRKTILEEDIKKVRGLSKDYWGWGYTELPRSAILRIIRKKAGEIYVDDEVVFELSCRAQAFIEKIVSLWLAKHKGKGQMIEADMYDILDEVSQYTK